MKKYQKKPIIVEAEQWDGEIDNKFIHEHSLSHTNYKDKCKYCDKKLTEHGWIHNKYRGFLLCLNDWIIKDENGEYYPVKPDIFKKEYEEVNETTYGKIKRR